MPVNPGWGTGGWGQGGWGNEPVESLPIGAYLALLTSEYRLSPKLKALLLMLLQKADDITRCLAQFDFLMDLDNATGELLDMLGSIVGASRTVSFQPSNGVSPILDDTTFRTLIYAQIAQNHWDGTIGSLQAVWQQLFPGGKIIIADNQNMTATVIVTGSFTSITLDLIRNGYICPRPQGVLYTYDFGTLPAFGFDSNNAYVAGFDTGHFV